MALKNAQDNYLKIIKIHVDKSIVQYEIWKDESTRQNPTDFDTVMQLSLHCGTLEGHFSSFESTGNIKNDLTACGYLALKDEPPFNGASGETWTDC